MSLSLDAEVLPKAVRDFSPEWGIVLGSGLGSLVEEVDAIMSLPYEEMPGMPVSTVSGHAGRFVFGRLAGRRVLVAQGRVHLYEGRTAEEVTFFKSVGLGAEDVAAARATYEECLRLRLGREVAFGGLSS